jgi:hypothetical protein
MPPAPYKLLGKYRTPTFRYGQRVDDERRGEVRIVSLSAGRIPWPIGRKGRAQTLVLYRDLATAVRRESLTAVRYWWGVGASAVRRWRRALGVLPINEGTRARKVAYGKSKAHRPAIDAMLAVDWDAERRAKVGSSRRGKPRPKHVLQALLKANVGRKLSAEHRRKMSEAHKRRGTRPPWLNKAWAKWEDEAVRTLPPAEAARKTGRTLPAVWSRRHELGMRSRRSSRR